MKEQHDYLNDISEIRQMMVRSSKFLSLSGWAGILAGTFALIGAWFAHSVLEFQPDRFLYSHSNIDAVLITAAIILIFSLIAAFFDSQIKAKKVNEKAWNVTSKNMLTGMSVPLLIGGTLILILSFNSLPGLAAPLMLIFYGLSLYIAGFYTFREVRVMGFVQMGLGILNTFFISTGLLFWTIGFGAVHILYGLYMHFKYER